MYYNSIYAVILWIIIVILLCGASHSAGQPTAGDIEISDQTEIPTKGIFRDTRSVVFCSKVNIVDFIIIHQQNFEINCDPDPTTPAGIRYLILTEEPSQSHIRDLATLRNLPIHKKDGEIVILGSGVADDLAIKESQLASLGLERPFGVWIIPFISHNIQSTTFEGHFESVDHCLDFNLGAAVSFKALKMVNFLFRVNRKSQGELEFHYNEIWGKGGLPELHPLEGYLLHAVDDDTGDTMTVIRTGDKDRFKPKTRTGTLFILVTDSLGCESGGTSGFNFVQPTIQLYSRDEFAYRGDVRCMPVYADNFFDMERFSISMSWNAKELRLTDLTDVHPLLAQGIIAVDTTRAAEGIMKFTWQDTMNFKLVPGTKLFDLCFEVLANPGTKAEISFDGNGTYFDNGNFQSEWEGKTGTITVGPETWNVVRYYTYCYSGQDSVDITFYTLGNAPPFIMEIPEAGISKSGIQGNEITFTDFPVGEFSYRLTDSAGGTHYVHNAINIPSGTQKILSLAEAIPPECGADNGLIKLNTIESDYQYIHLVKKDETGPGVDEYFPPKTFFEDLASGTYTFIISDAGGCHSKPLVVELPGKPSLSVSVEQADASCDGSATQSKIVFVDENKDTVNVSFTLDSRENYASNTYFNFTPGKHTVDVNHANFCEFRKQITIPDNPASDNSVKLRVDEPEVTKGEPFVVLAEYENTSKIDTFEWTPLDKLLMEEPDKATFALDSSSWISLKMTDEQGCTYMDRVFINITEEEESEEELSFFIPNSFTPNGDSTNDRLEFFTNDQYISIQEVRIYDRYGNILHTNTDSIPMDDLWDGRSNQQKVPPGVYVLQIHIRKGSQSIKQFFRDITVIR